MPRHARIYNSGEYHHIMVRGVNRQNIFEDDEDRQRFLDTLRRFLGEENVELLAWCLISNHAHLLLHSSLLPDRFMKKLGCSYVPYFNRKYGRTGHLFQDRYRSESIADERYLLAVIRYIHMNPQKAGICAMKDYTWSSYGEYLSGEGITSTGPVLDMLSGKAGFVAFMETTDDGKYMDYDSGLTEPEAVRLAQELLPDGLFSPQAMEKAERKAVIEQLHRRGLTAAQICRVTGLGKTVVYGILK